MYSTTQNNNRKKSEIKVINICYIIKLRVQEFHRKISLRKSDAFVSILNDAGFAERNLKTGSVKRQQESWAFPRWIRGVNHKDRFYGPEATVRHGDVERRPDKAAAWSCVSLLLDSWVVGKDSIVAGKE